MGRNSYKKKDINYRFPFAKKEDVIQDESTGKFDKPDEDIPGIKKQKKKKGSAGVSVFGADMDIATKQKLEARQHLNLMNRHPNESIQSRYSSDNSISKFRLDDPALGVNLQFAGDADFSSRTPIVRMWTAVQLETYSRRRDWHKSRDDNYTRKPDQYNYIVNGSRVIER